MRSAYLRASLQVTFLLMFMPTLFFFGLGCLCMCPPAGGSDFSHDGELAKTIKTEDVLVGDGLVMRYHSLEGGALAMTQGESQVISQSVPSTFFGIRIPSAPDSTKPGDLFGDISASYLISGTPAAVPLRTDPQRSEQLEALYPPQEGTQWVGLVISDTSALDSLLQGPVDLSDAGAGLSYAIEFGSQPCNGCEVQLVGCVPEKFGGFLPPSLIAARTDAGGTPMACSRPVSTYITLYDFSGQPLPGPVTAAFGLWGSRYTTSTVGGTAVLPVKLEHTSVTTLTFALDPVQSGLGWSYAWQDSLGTPISQVVVGPRTPFVLTQPPNLRLVAQGVPTCTQVVDMLDLQATNTLTPALQAKTTAYLNVLPDPATCPTADVAAYHVQQTSVISGGDGITYTLTVTNLTDSPVDGIIEQTLTPAVAVSGAVLPGGCLRAGAVVTCQLDNIPAQGAKSATVVIRPPNSYGGTLRSEVKAQPAGATDPAFLDNIHGPLTATVQPNGRSDKYYLPIISKKP
jgi:hypothetical protein